MLSASKHSKEHEPKMHWLSHSTKKEMKEEIIADNRLLDVLSNYQGDVLQLQFALMCFTIWAQLLEDALFVSGHTASTHKAMLKLQHDCGRSLTALKTSLN